MNSEHSDHFIEATLEPKSEADLETLRAALIKHADRDSSIHFSDEHERGIILLGGMSEEHLDEIIATLKRDSGTEFDVGAPQIAYRETLLRTSTIDYTHKRLTGSSGEFARVRIRFEPAECGAGFTFENKATIDSVPERFVAAVESGLDRRRLIGLLTDSPVVDFKATLEDGAFHNEDSSEVAFQAAAEGAFDKLKTEGNAVMIEPIMMLEIVTPKVFASPVVDDLNSRRGMILDQRLQDGVVTIGAEVPLARLSGYAASLRSISGGRAKYTMRFDHYAHAPSSPNGDDNPPFPPAVGMRA